MTSDYNSYGKKGPDDNMDLDTRLEAFHQTYDSDFQDAIQALRHIKAQTVRTDDGAYWSVNPERDIGRLENMRDLDFKLPPRRQKTEGDEQYVPIPSLEVHVPAALNNIAHELLHARKALSAAGSTDEREKNRALMAIDKGIKAAADLYEDFQYGNYYARLHKAVQASRDQDSSRKSWEKRTESSTPPAQVSSR